MVDAKAVTRGLDEKLAELEYQQKVLKSLMLRVATDEIEASNDRARIRGEQDGLRRRLDFLNSRVVSQASIIMDFLDALKEIDKKRGKRFGQTTRDYKKKRIGGVRLAKKPK